MDETDSFPILTLLVSNGTPNQRYEGGFKNGKSFGFLCKAPRINSYEKAVQFVNLVPISIDHLYNSLVQAKNTSKESSYSNESASSNDNHHGEVSEPVKTKSRASSKIEWQAISSKLVPNVPRKESSTVCSLYRCI